MKTNKHFIAVDIARIWGGIEERIAVKCILNSKIIRKNENLFSNDTIKKFACKNTQIL